MNPTERAGVSPAGRAALAVGAILLLFAGLAGLRTVAWEIRLPGPALGFGLVHALRPDPAPAVVRTATPDPWLELVLPPRLRPVDAVTLRIQRLGPVGERFSMYYVPAGAAGGFSEDWKVFPVRRGTGEVYELTWTFPRPATAVRMDPPDYAEFRIDEARFRVHPFARIALPGPLMLLATAIALVGGAIGWGRCAATLRRALAVRAGPWVVVVAAGAIKLWLVGAQSVQALGEALHDDALFLRLAEEIAHGHWLGAYDQMTLVKGPMLSVWLAGAWWLGLPFLLSLQLGYLAACGAVVRGLGPRLANAWWRAGLFVWLAFNPATFAASESCRILRNTLAGLLALAALGLLHGAVLRWRASRGRLAGWAGAGGLVLGCFWLTREEAVWILAPLALLGIAVAWEWWRERPPGAGSRLLLLFGLPALGWALIVGGVCALNWSHYGWWGTVEFRTREFADAYGALTRVKPVRWQSQVPVPHERWHEIAAASPAFAELVPYLEGPAGAHWRLYGATVAHDPPDRVEIRAAWFMWALRDAAAFAGHHRNPAGALAFYRRLAAEVNAACDTGRLPAVGPRSGFLPPWHPTYNAAATKTAWWALNYVLTEHDFCSRTPPSVGTDAALAEVASFTRERLAPRAGAPVVSAPDLRFAIMDQVAGTYARVLPWAFGLAAAAWLAAVLRALAVRRLPVPLALATALLAGTGADIAIVTLVHVTSFNAVSIGYLSSVYGMVLWFVAAAPLALREVWTLRRAGEEVTP